ncbi:MAG: N-acetyltransferase family protein [Hyphomonadaceae bacterium]
MIVRQLTADDLAAYRALHRFALTESPLAFVETPRNDEARADSVVRDMLERGEGWGVFDAGRLVGKLVIDALPYDCLAHTRWLHAVYVHPDGRGKGAGDALLGAAIAHERERGASRVALWVNDRNAAARRLYERSGFVETGRVPQGVKVGAEYADDVLMTLALASL